MILWRSRQRVREELSRMALDALGRARQLMQDNRAELPDIPQASIATRRALQGCPVSPSPHLLIPAS